jgi:cupin fold WbuC family metalloprotein
MTTGLDQPGFRRLEGAKTATWVAQDDVVVVSPEILADLKRAASTDPLGRARVCLHRENNDAVHQMIIAHHRRSYTHPHRHRSKSESFHVLEGRLAVVLFDDEGRVTRRILLSPPGSGEPAVYRLSASLWHTVVPLTDHVVFHEITSGPFVRGSGEAASWAPEEADVAHALTYAAQLVADLA